MSGNPTWDKWREELRETLCNRILGEIRLAHSDRDGILETCDDVLQALWEFHIKDECPEYPAGEFDMLIRFAVDEVDQTAARHAAEQEAWPRETDCDRLDRVEADLRNRLTSSIFHLPSLLVQHQQHNLAGFQGCLKGLLGCAGVFLVPGVIHRVVAFPMNCHGPGSPTRLHCVNDRPRVGEPGEVRLKTK